VPLPVGQPVKISAPKSNAILANTRLFFNIKPSSNNMIPHIREKSYKKRTRHKKSVILYRV
jgi:hypothetical protein